MTRCSLAERVAAYASGEPDDALAAHLPSCAECRAELDAAHATLRAFAPLVSDARDPARADAHGELFWADFTRSVRKDLDSARARTRRAWLWAALPALAAAGALFILLRAPAAEHALVPAPTAYASQADPDPAADDAGDADPFDAVDSLPDDALDSVLARLDDALAPADDDASDTEVDPFDTVDALPDDSLDDVLDTLPPKPDRKGV